MSINLISFITQYLTPEVIAKISFALGLDKSTAGKAIAAAVPGPCRSLGRRLDAGRIAQAIRRCEAAAPARARQSGRPVRRLGSEGGPRQWDQYADVRARWVWSIRPRRCGGEVRGPRSRREFVAARAPGAGGDRRARSEGGRNSTPLRLAQLLTSQKSNISAALPSGFSEMRGSSGLLGALGAGAASPAATAAPRAVAATANRAAAQASGGWPQWLTWALPALAVLALGWMYFGRPAPTAVEEAKTTATQAAQGVADQTRQAAGQVAQAAANFAEQAKAAAAPALKSLQDVTAGGVNVGTAMQTAMTSTDQLAQGHHRCGLREGGAPQTAGGDLSARQGLRNRRPIAGGRPIGPRDADRRGSPVPRGNLQQGARHRGGRRGRQAHHRHDPREARRHREGLAVARHRGETADTKQLSPGRSTWRRKPISARTNGRRSSAARCSPAWPSRSPSRAGSGA